MVEGGFLVALLRACQLGFPFGDTDSLPGRLKWVLMGPWFSPPTMTPMFLSPNDTFRAILAIDCCECQLAAGAAEAQRDNSARHLINQPRIRD